MEPTDFRFPSSLAYWTVYEVLTQNQEKHADRDWAATTQDENFSHIDQHLHGYDDALLDGDIPESEQHLRHALVRSVMLYWAFLREEGLLDQRLQLKKESK